jgi:hypothetical protein
MPNVCWLWWWIFWPIAALVQIIWAATMIGLAWGRSRRDARNAAGNNLDAARIENL